MSGLTEAGSGGQFLNVTQGRIRLTVDENTPGAKKREWETPDGKHGVKWEKVFSKISGIINKIEFKEGEYGEQINVTVDCKGETFILTMQSNSRYAIDFMKRLPGIDINREVELTPYDVEDNGKRNTGIKLVQDKEVFRNFFWDYEEKKSVNGFPKMTIDHPDKDDWKVFFIGVKKFLKEYTLEKVVPKISFIVAQDEKPEPADYQQPPEFEDDLPF